MLRKALLISLFYLIVFSSGSSAQIVTYINNAVFNLPGKSPYLELYLRIPAGSLKFVATGEGYEAGVKVSVAVLQGEKVVFHDKYKLTSPVVDDTTATDFDLIDLKRTYIENGDYLVSVEVEDMYDSLSFASSEHQLTVSMPSDSVFAMSDIVLLDSIYPVNVQDKFTRYNFNFIPSVISLFGPEKQNLMFYTEAYYAGKVLKKGSAYFRAYLKDTGNQVIESTKKTRSKPAEDITFYFDAIPLQGLPSGKYTLYIDLLNVKEELIGRRKIAFLYYERTRETVKAAEPVNEQIIAGSAYYKLIFSEEEQFKYDSLLATTDSTALKSWSYDFWKGRNPADPWLAYKRFMDAVEVVNKNYSTKNIEGYRTDRGRIYLKYGRPDNISPFPDEVNAYEYEIWHYYSTGYQTNVRFVFYNPTQIPNDLTLLHSTMRGEFNNPRWKQMIYSRASKSRSIEDNSSPNIIGSQLDRQF